MVETTNAATIARSNRLLTDEMLARFNERAPVYDRENRFLHEDFEELRASGYLNAALPPEFGGPGLNLSEVSQLQRRLAYYAPATAIAVNMHFYWTGVAADLHRADDTSLDWILEASAQGGVFAAGHGESGNDVPVFLSTTKAERVAGGWEFTGHKIFGSLSPVWTYFGLHGMDMNDPQHPQVVHAFLSRDAVGYRIEPTWDVLGMRATESNDTILERAFVPDSQIALHLPARFRRRGVLPRQPVRVGAAWLRYRLRRHRAARLRHHGGADAQAQFDRAHAVDGASPRGAAPRGRDAHGAGGHRCTPRPRHR